MGEPLSLISSMRPALAGLVALGLGCRSAAVPPDRPVDERSVSLATMLDSVVPGALAKTAASGAVVVVVDSGRVSFSKGFGLADKQHDVPMTDSTPIGVASVSKLVSSWGLLRLVATGRLALDRPIDSVVQSWHLPPSRFDRNGVTVRRLLSHTAGLSMLSVPCFPADSTRPSLTDVLNGRAGDRGKVELMSPPGSEWRYSGGGFTLLQLAAEERVGRPFVETMREEVLSPLGMAASYFGPAKAGSATGYDDGGHPVKGFQCVGETAAGLVTTGRDMAKLLLEYGRARRDSSWVLPAAWIDSLAKPIAKAALTIDGRSIDMGDAQMGLGHFIHIARDGRRILFHSGGNPGVGAYLLIDLDHDGGVFAAVNSDSAGDVMRAILAAWGAWSHTDPPTFF